MFRKIKLIITIYRELKVFRSVFPKIDSNGEYTLTDYQLKLIESYRYYIFELLLQLFDRNFFWNHYKATRIIKSSDVTNNKDNTD